ncbi:MAG: hypothetical protein H6R21_1560 [Proteobacteria bacterium]|nr:hypothetical protein [Pseudomonadota bacterium]
MHNLLFLKIKLVFGGTLGRAERLQRGHRRLVQHRQRHRQSRGQLIVRIGAVQSLRQPAMVYLRASVAKFDMMPAIFF